MTTRDEGNQLNRIGGKQLKHAFKMWYEYKIFHSRSLFQGRQTEGQLVVPNGNILKTAVSGPWMKGLMNGAPDSSKTIITDETKDLPWKGPENAQYQITEPLINRLPDPDSYFRFSELILP